MQNLQEGLRAKRSIDTFFAHVALETTCTVLAGGAETVDGLFVTSSKLSRGGEIDEYLTLAKSADDTVRHSL